MTNPKGIQARPPFRSDHSYTQTGDLMCDPEMVFEVDAAGAFHSVSFQQDNLGIYKESWPV